MKIEELAKEHFRVEQIMQSHSSELIKELLEHRAAKKDDQIKNKLLKELVSNYSLAEKNLFELNQLKNKFLGMAAHDLRNPLTSIRGFSEILFNEELGPVTEEQKEFLKIINTTSDEMLTLLNDLLDISVIESGKLDIRLKRGSLKKLLEDRIKINKVIADKKNITIQSKLADTPDIQFDPNRIIQVFDNLASNAIKFSPRDSNIYITLSKKDKMLRVSVKDEGPGISEEDQSRLFGEFQRLSAQPTGGEKSTGLGLAIVKKVIEAHNGTLEVESEPGEGATFSFKLPMEE